VHWDSTKQDTSILDAVFIAPKTYAYITNNKTIVKIKGASTQNIVFNDLKNAFYNNEDLIHIQNLSITHKHNFILSSESKSKYFALNLYDKRKFIDKKQNTEPFFYENFTYS
jgi:hypothetical protein